MYVVKYSLEVSGLGVWAMLVVVAGAGGGCPGMGCRVSRAAD